MNKLVAKTIVLILFFTLPFSIPAFADEEEATSTEVTEVQVEDTVESIATTTSDILTEEDVVEDISTSTDELVEVEPLVESEEDQKQVITGELTEDQVWTSLGGSYYTSDLYIPSGVTLTVMPGTRIYVSGYIYVAGTLEIQGSGDNHVSIEGSGWYIGVESEARMSISNADLDGADGIFVDGAAISLDHVNYTNATDGLFVNDQGSITADHLNISNLYYAPALTALNRSSISITDSVVEGASGYALIAGYSDSKLSITDSTVTPIDGTAIALIGGSLELERAILADGPDHGIELYPYQSDGYIRPKVSIKNSTINGFSRDGIYAIDPDLTIESSKLEDNKVGIEMYARRQFSAKVSQSSFDLNNTGIIFFRQDAGAIGAFDVANNWWGDASGPHEPARNPTSTGVAIDTYNSNSIDRITYDPWLKSPPGSRNPVIIIPGIMASYLNRNDNAKTPVWVNKAKLISPSDEFLDELIMDELGRPDTSHPIMLPTDILRSENGTDFFQGLIERLTSEGYKEGVDLFVFPYDWRLDIRSAADNLYSPALVSLSDKVDTVLGKTRAEKVNIIAHSMGGLLAKNYIKHYGQDKVNKFVDIATPHLGAPKAAKILLYGDDMDIKKFNKSILNSLEIKKISQNMPAVYQLLPSERYFSTTTSDYLYYLYDISDFDNDSVRGRLDFSQSTSFLANTGRNIFLLRLAKDTHQDLDDFDPDDYDIDAYNIVGCGIPTMGKIFTNIKKNKKDYEYQIQYISGDGTVPQRSAEYLSTQNLFYASGSIEHATMPSDSNITNLISSILSNSLNNFDYAFNTSISTSTVNCKLPSGKYMSFHSPVDVHIYDAGGGHTGPDINGDIEYGIPGVTYDILDDNKFIFVPDGNYTVKLVATGDGTFDARVKYTRDGSILSTVYFESVPITGGVSSAEVKTDSNNTRIDLNRNNDENIVTILPTSESKGDTLDNIEIEVQDSTPEYNLQIQPASGRGGRGFVATSTIVQTENKKVLGSLPILLQPVSTTGTQPKQLQVEVESDIMVNDGQKEKNSNLALALDTDIFPKLFDYLYSSLVSFFKWLFFKS